MQRRRAFHGLAGTALGLLLLACGSAGEGERAMPDPTADDDGPRVDRSDDPTPEGDEAREDEARAPQDDAPGATAADPDAAEDPSGEDAEPADPAPRRGIRWLLDLGPTAPTGPSAFRAYALLAAGDCQGLLDRFDEDHPQAISLGPQPAALYEAAALACLAALEDRPELWTAATEAAEGAGHGSGSCFDLVARRLLDDLLAAWREDPDARFEVEQGRGAAQAPPCPALTTLVPPEGPAGTTVRVEGDHLGAVTAIDLVSPQGARTIGGDALAAGRTSEQALEFVIPDDLPPGRWCVLLLAEPAWDADAAAFTVTAPPAEESTDGRDGGEGASDATGDADEPGTDADPGAGAAESGFACPPAGRP